MELGEALGAVPALQQEAAAFGHFGQVVLERPRLAGEDQRGKLGQGALDHAQCGGVFISGKMPRFAGLPAVGCPVTRHVECSFVRRAHSAPAP
jgi:hypothetical protein